MRLLEKSVLAHENLTVFEETDPWGHENTHTHPFHVATVMIHSADSQV